MRLLLFTEIFNHKDVPSFDAIKNDITTLIFLKSKSFFKIHDPAGLQYLFQLRVSLSPLKCHKWCHIFMISVMATKASRIQVIIYFIARLMLFKGYP